MMLWPAFFRLILGRNCPILLLPGGLRHVGGLVGAATSLSARCR